MLVLLCRCAGFVSTLVMSICWFCKNTRCNDVCFASVHHQTYRCFSHIPCTFLSPHKSFVSVIFHASIHQHTICCLSPYSARVLSSHIPLFQSYSTQVFITTHTVVSVILHAAVHHYTYRCFSHIPCNCSSPHIPLFRSYSMQLFITTHTLVSVILHASVLPAKMAGRQTAVQHDQRDAVHAQQPFHEPHLEAAHLLPQRPTLQAA